MSVDFARGGYAKSWGVSTLLAILASVGTTLTVGGAFQATGSIDLQATAAESAYIDLHEDTDDAGDHHYRLQAPAALTSHRTLTPPDEDLDLSALGGSVDLGTVWKTADGTYGLKAAKLDGTAAPAVTDDSDDGYVLGSIWYDTTNDTVYDLLDPTAGAAVWVERGGSGASAAADVTLADAGELYTAGDVEAALAEVRGVADAALPLSGGQLTGNVTFSGAQTVDTRDVSADGAALDKLPAQSGLLGPYTITDGQAATAIDGTNLRWAYASVKGVMVSVDVRNVDGLASRHSTITISLNGQPTQALIESKAEAGATGITYTLANGGDGYCYLRAAATSIAQNRTAYARVISVF